MLKINLNQKIKFKLTDEGIKYLRERHNKIYGQFAKQFQFSLPDKDKNGYCTLHLWEFMGKFGNALQVPTINPVVEPDIYLTEE